MKADLRHLRYFLAAADHLQFGRAARALGVQQPTVSRQVIDLEDQLGVRLFDRHARGLRLTGAGSTFAEDARRIIVDLDEAERRALRAGQAEIGVLRLAFYSSLASGRLVDFLRAYHQRWPEVEIKLVEASPSQQISLLEAGRIDLALLAATAVPPDSGTDSADWWVERVFAAMPDDHPLADRDAVSWSDLQDELFIVRSYETGPMIYNWLARRLPAAQLLPNILQQDVSRESLLGLVEAGFGLTIVSEPATLLHVPGVVYRPIVDDNAAIEIRAAWLRKNVNPVLRRALSFAREFLKTGSRPWKGPCRAAQRTC